MKKYLLFALLSIFTAALVAQTAPGIIPQPVEMQVLKGRFRLTPATTIGYGSPAARPTAEILAARIGTSTGYRLKTAATGIIQLRLNATPDKPLGTEGYTLHGAVQI